MTTLATIHGLYTTIPPALAADGIAKIRIDSDAILLTKAVGGGGVPYAQGQLAPVSPATQAAILNSLPIGVYNPAIAALAVGDGSPPQVDDRGRLITVDRTPLPAFTGAVDATDALVAVVGGGEDRNLLQVQGYNSSAALRYFMLFDLAASPPANGTAPDWPAVPVPPGTAFAVSFARLPFSTGIVWASSTTRLTLTLTGAADMSVGIIFE